MKRFACVALTTLTLSAALSLIGCQSNGDDGSGRNPNSHSDTSAQVGTGTDSGTSGASSGSVSPSR